MSQGFVNTSYVSTSATNQNLIIGGNFDTNPWQRGTSFTGITGVTSTTFISDRFQWCYNGAGVVTGSKATDAPTVAQTGSFSQYSLSMAVTTADTSIVAADYYLFRYNMEGYDWAQIAQRTFTISFWVKATKTGVYCVSLNNSLFDQSYVVEYTVSSSNVWEKKTIVVTASPSSGTWDYTNGRGLTLSFVVSAGSGYLTATTNTWLSGNFLQTSNQVNGMDTVGNLFRLALVKVEQGGTATPYIYESPQTVLARCQRYFTKMTNSAEGYQTVGASISGRGYFKVTMRAIPTISNLTTTSSNNLSGSPVAFAITTDSVTIYNAVTASASAFGYFTYDASAEL